MIRTRFASHWLLGLSVSVVFAVVLAAAGFTQAAPAQSITTAQLWTVTAPGGKLRAQVGLIDQRGQNGYPAGPRLYYNIESGTGAGRTIVLPWSPLGLVRADEDFVDGLTFVSTREATVEDVYTLPRGKARSVKARGHERTVVLESKHKARIELIVRAYDDGVAFRYQFPETQPGVFQVVNEATGFRIPAGARATLMPYDNPSRYTPGYEQYWQTNVAVGTAAPYQAGWGFPALFHVGTRWLLLTESGLDRHYFAGRLAQEAPGGLYRVRLPDVGEGAGLGPILPQAALPWLMPWRVVLVGEGLAPIIESSLVTTLAPPTKIKDTSWIKPGRAAWSWWSDDPSPRQYERMLPFIDFASEMGWEYFLVDANWDRMKGGTWRDIATYAAKKNVKILLWYNSGGPGNTVPEAPRDRMYDRERRRAEMKAIAEAGVAGMKVDFFQSDKQATIEQYIDILEDAAEFKLLVNFHGCTLPRGWERTYPNLVGHEAVRGAEQYKFDEHFGERAPAHNVALAFARNVVGPMDYTPVVFSDTKHPHTTTNAHELALSVVFETGVQHFADSVTSYRALPDEPRAFLKAVPAVWDETRYLAGEPDTFVVLARRHGRDWYVGGISGETTPRTLVLPLRFLGAGRYSATIIADGDGDRTWRTHSETKRASEALTVELRARGGVAVRLSPL